jgi:DNA-directed RNA polymerase subunit delta
MNDKLKNLAMLDVAEAILKENKEPIAIQTLLQKVAEIKDVDLDDVDRLTQLYMDITQSAKFVYCGEEQWDLKERNLELWDKDGYAFVQAEEIEEDTEEDLDFTEYQLDEEEDKPVVVDDEDEIEDVEEDEEEKKEESAYIEVKLPILSTDDDDEDDELDIEFDDEDDYNEIMDDYEDMYDDE